MTKTLGSEKITSVFCMLKGEPGTWKSSAAVTFPTPQFWFSQDGKMNSILKPARMHNVDLSKIEYDQFKTWTEMEKRVESFQLNCKYKTIIVDSVTTTGDTVNFETLGVKSRDEKGKKVGGIRVNSIEDYNAQSAAFTSLLSRFKDIREFHNVNIVLIAHVVGERQITERSVTNAARTIVTGGKAISGKIPAYCDEIYHFDVVPNPVEGGFPDFQIFTVPTGFDFARTALNLPPKFLISPNKNLWKDFIAPAIEEMNSFSEKIGETK